MTKGKRKIRQIFSLLLCAALLLMLLPATALGAGTTHEVGSAAELYDLIYGGAGPLGDGDTIELTASITDFVYSINITNNITFDVGEYILDIETIGQSALRVDGGAVSLVEDGGALNVSVTANNIPAVNVLNGGKATVTSAEANVVDGPYAIGVKASGAGSEIVVTGNVTAISETCRAVYVEKGGKVEVGGNVAANGENTYGASYGVYVYDDFFDGVTAGNTAIIGGDVVVTGMGCFGVYIQGHNAADSSAVTVVGDVSATGTGCRGLRAWQNCEVEIGGDVSAVGTNCRGIDTEGSDIDVAGAVSAQGLECRGIDAMIIQGTMIITVNDGITADGDGCVGLYAVTEGGDAIEVDSNISVSGEESIGVKIDEVEPFTLDGNITATGAGSIGAVVVDDGVAVIDGTISAPIYVGVNAILDDIYDISSYITQNAADGVPGTGAYADYLVYTDTTPDPDPELTYYGAGTVYVLRSDITTYTVTFVDWDDIVLRTETVAHGGSATAPANPSRAGYTFTGWSPDFSYVTSALTVTAQYRRNRSGGGGNDDTTASQTSTPPVTPPAPQPENRIVLGIGQPELNLNGSPRIMDAPPYIDPETGRAMAPIRFIGEVLGAAVEYDAVTRQIRITSGDTEILLILDSRTAFINGVAVQLDQPPVIVPPGRTFVPLRFISEALGATVEYDPDTRQISISK